MKQITIDNDVKNLEKLKNFVNMEIPNLTREIELKEVELTKTWSSLGSSLFAWLSTDSEYKVMSDQLQGSLQSIINSVDWGSLNIGTFEDAQKYIKENIFKLFQMDGIGEEISSLINLDGDLTGKELIAQWDVIIEKLRDMDVDEEVIDILLNFTIDERNALDKLDEVKALLAEKFTVDPIKLDNFIDGVDDVDEIEILCRLINDENGDYKDFNDFENQYEAAVKQERTIEVFDISPYSSAIESVQSKISSLSTALKSLKEGTFTAEDFISIMMEFPEAAEGVDATSDSFEGLEENLKKLVSDAPKNLIKQLKEFRETNELTDEAAKSIDNLISSLEGISAAPIDELSDYYGVLADAINSATKAKTKFDEALQKDTSDVGYAKRIEALEILKESLGSGEVGVGNTKYVAASELLSGTMMTPEEAQAWIAANAQYYTEGSKGLQAWLNNLMALKAAGKLEGTGADVERLADGSFNLSYDINYLGEFADALGITEEALQDFINKYRMYSQSWVYGSPEETFTEFKNAGIVNIVSNETESKAYASLDRIKEYALTHWEEAKEQLEASGVNIVNDSQLREFDGFIDGTWEEVNRLADALKTMGINSGEMTKLFAGNEEAITTFRTLLGLIGWTQEDIDILIGELLEYSDVVSNLNGLPEIAPETPEVKVTTEKEENVTYTVDANTEPIDEKVGVIRQDAEENPIVYNIDGNASSILSTLNAITSKTFTTTLQIKQEIIGGEVTPAATGTNYFPGGTALLGDEYSPTGSPKPELVISGSEAYLAGVNGPEILNLSRGDQVLTYDETKKVLGNNYSHSTLPAFSGGTGANFSGYYVHGSSSAKSTETSGNNYDDELRELEHLLKMKLITYTEYVDGLIYLEEKYRSELQKDTDQWYGAIEKIFDAEMDLYDARDKRLEHSLHLLKEYYNQAEDKLDYQRMEDTLQKQADIYQQMMENAHAEADRLRALGVPESDEAISDLQDQWWDAYNKRQDILEQQYKNGLDLYDKYLKDADALSNWGANSEIAILKTEYFAAAEPPYRAALSHCHA